MPERGLEGGGNGDGIRCRMTGAPLFIHRCHCRWGQRASGAAWAPNAIIASNRLAVWQGEPQLVDTPTNSGKSQLVARYPRRRAALWSHYAGAGKAPAFVRAGTVQEPARTPPEFHIFSSARWPWLQVSPEIPDVPHVGRSRCLLAGKQPFPAQGIATRARTRGRGVANMNGRRAAPQVVRHHD